MRRRLGSTPEHHWEFKRQKTERVSGCRKVDAGTGITDNRQSGA